jgi:enterochelin esterase-like enzyme
MLDWLLTFRIDSKVFLITLDALAAVLSVLLLVWPPRRSRVVRGIAAIILGAAVGLLVCWLVSDVENAFGLPLTSIVRMWVALAFAGVFLAITNLWGARTRRKVLALVAVPVFLGMAAAGINIDFGAYPTLPDALGISRYPTLTASHLTGKAGRLDPTLATTWHAPVGMPTHGRVGMVTIPGTVSHFTPRDAAVYLPPAALLDQPPVLPVLVVFGGQPGAPQDMFSSGRIATILDAYAGQHGGLAPIVVSPDQLGRRGSNPMCVDSPYGNAETYVTVDVSNWIRSHLRVSDDPRYWAVGGYSEGGTCSIQFGAGHPELFGSVVDILGELRPTIGPNTVASAFGSSQSAYEAVTPIALLARYAPYADSYAIFGEGARDTKYAGFGRVMQASADRAGMHTRLIVSPGSGHDWNTVRYVLARALPDLSNHLGLSR